MSTWKVENPVSLSSIQIVFGIFTLMQLFKKLRNYSLLVDGTVNSLAGALWSASKNNWFTTVFLNFCLVVKDQELS